MQRGAHLVTQLPRKLLHGGQVARRVRVSRVAAPAAVRAQVPQGAHGSEEVGRGLYGGQAGLQRVQHLRASGAAAAACRRSGAWGCARAPCALCLLCVRGAAAGMGVRGKPFPWAEGNPHTHLIHTVRCGWPLQALLLALLTRASVTAAFAFDAGAAAAAAGCTERVHARGQGCQRAAGTAGARGTRALCCRRWRCCCPCIRHAQCVGPQCRRGCRQWRASRLRCCWWCCCLAPLQGAARLLGGRRQRHVLQWAWDGRAHARQAGEQPAGARASVVGR